MTDAEKGAELIAFFAELMDMPTMRAYQQHPTSYIAGKVTSGMLHQESANLITSGNLTAVTTAIHAADPQYQTGTIVMPPM